MATEKKDQAQERLCQYPPIECYQHGLLDVGDGHHVYYEQSGNPEGKPVIFVHGGPGGGSDPDARRFWDPESYRIVLFDERGCGKSTPHACLEHNTTWHLVADMEKIREKLEIEKWQVFGGSWGSTLSLTYAMTHPDRVAELVLRGIFTLRKKELRWFYQEGCNYLYPDAWEQYVKPIPEEERGDMMAAYLKRLTSDDEETRLEAARAWSIWEASTSCLHPNPKKTSTMSKDQFALAFARIENHYFVNEGWFERDGWLLEKEQVEKIRHIPCVIVQGRHDLVCPPDTAWSLHRQWPEAEFRLVQDAGHSASEPGITHELIKATRKFA